MKSVIVSSVCVSAVLFVLAIQTVIDGKTAYKQELEDSLSVAVAQTAREVLEQESFGIENRNEFIAAFLQAMVIRTNSDVDMTVHVKTVDLEKGRMDIEVTEKVELFQQYEEEIRVRRTVVFAN